MYRGSDECAVCTPSNRRIRAEIAVRRPCVWANIDNCSNRPHGSDLSGFWPDQWQHNRSKLNNETGRLRRTSLNHCANLAVPAFGAIISIKLQHRAVQGGLRTSSVRGKTHPLTDNWAWGEPGFARNSPTDEVTICRNFAGSQRSIFSILGKATRRSCINAHEIAFPCTSKITETVERSEKIAGRAGRRAFVEPWKLLTRSILWRQWSPADATGKSFWSTEILAHHARAFYREARSSRSAYSFANSFDSEYRRAERKIVWWLLKNMTLLLWPQIKSLLLAGDDYVMKKKSYEIKNKIDVQYYSISSILKASKIVCV